MREADVGDLFLVRLGGFMSQVLASCSYICGPAGVVVVVGG